ncbi:MAG: disulfide reductase [Clostridiaceae bacterium]|nr:disulfide reductase [Clostridiaceae bacterium]
MTFDYYPGCTLKTKAKELDIHARSAAEALGIKLEELTDWQCCGAVYPMAKDEIATRLSSVRALAASRDNGRDLLTLCSACHHVIKRVNNDMQTDEEIRTKVNNYMSPETEYHGETKVVHYLEMLRDTIGFDTIRQRAVKPLTGKKIGAYYGCLLLRPNKVMAFDNPENPTVLEDFIRALGAEPVIYPYRNECCGGYISLENNELSAKKCDQITVSALENKADMLITACPLCMYNLDANTNSEHKTKLPIVYFTELLAQVLDI